MIRRIYLDLDDVCNTLAPFALNAMGRPIGPSDDYGENTERFEAHGGRAILVPRPWSAAWDREPRGHIEEKLRFYSNSRPVQRSIR
jgi:hypothetical protein